MKLQDGMLLFHGSYCPVEAIDLDKCNWGKDFGRVFYLTSDALQAHNFINSSLRKAKKSGDVPVKQKFGYVSSFIFHDRGLETYQFETTDREWLWFVALNRRRGLAQILKPKIDKTIFNAEIIIGKVANDNTNPVITTYLEGLYGDYLAEKTIKTAVDLLMPDNLSDQFCFLTERAVHCLEFVEAKKYAI